MRLLILAFASMLLADEVAKKPMSIPMREVSVVKGENLILRQQLLDNEKRVWFAETCKSAGIEAPDFEKLSQVCFPDIQAKTVARRDPPKPDAK